MEENIMQIPAKAALIILNLYKYFEERVSKKRIIEIWKANHKKTFDQLKAIIQKELEEAA